MDSSIKVLTESDIRNLLAAMVKHGRPACVDWTNRSITVLSEVRVNPNVVLSTGPMTYRDYLHTVK